MGALGLKPIFPPFIPVASVEPATGSKLFSHTSHLTYGMWTSGRSCLNRNGIFCYLAINISPDILHSICGRPMIPSFQILLFNRLQNIALVMALIKQATLQLFSVWCAVMYLFR